MAYSIATPIAGSNQPGFLNTIDTVAAHQIGLKIVGVDPYFGLAEFMYVQFPASAAITSGQVLYLSGVGAVGNSASVAPNTANTGRLIAVALNPVASVASIQYGWVQVEGSAVVRAVASVAAGAAVGIDATTAGSVNAVTAGRQLTPCVSLAPSTNTVVKANTQTQSGSPIISTQDSSGWFLGITVSGTGIPGGTTIIGLDTDNRRATMSANATATGTVSVTGTFTGFIVAQIAKTSVQSQIT
jgi:hypothetical protein